MADPALGQAVVPIMQQIAATHYEISTNTNLPKDLVIQYQRMAARAYERARTQLGIQ